jgi:uncharacterized C2H2 Zn-finger protein
LVQFHIFKKSVKKYQSFEKVMANSKLFVGLETVLEKLETTDDLKILKYGENEVLIATQKHHERYELFRSFQPEVVIEEQPVVVEAVVVKEEPMQSLEPQKKRKLEIPSKWKDNETDSKRLKETVPDEPEEISQDDNNKKEKVNRWTNATTAHMPRWNTNSSLTEEQKVWIWEDARKSEVKENGKTIWKCSVCSSYLSSFWVLRKHLRDVHIIKPTKKTRDKRRSKDFMNEVRSCKKFDDGRKESYWQCNRCVNVHKSESGFIKHLLYQHINNAMIDPMFIAKCKIEIEYEDKERSSEVGWGCPECKKFYRSAVGLKNHFKLSHGEIDFGGEKYQQKVQEMAERSMIIKEEEKQSEIILETEKGQKKIWECKRCREPRYFRSESGFKTHMKILHLLTRNIDENKVANCRDIGEKIWKCSICTVTTKTKEGFMSHVSQAHPGVFDNDDKGENQETKSTTNIVSIPLRSQNPDELVLQKLAVQVVNERGGALKVDGYKFSCNECGLFFSKHYPTHVEAHKTLKQLTNCYELPNCQQCRVIYSNEDAMLKHLEWHIEESEVLPAYPSVGLAFYGGKEFKPPTGSADDAVDESTWKCGHCFAMFWDEDECVEHMMLLHMETLICPVDHLEFSGNRGLAQFCLHMKNKHPEKFPNFKFSCTYCKADFSSIFDKLSHMRNCVEKKLICDGCGKRFFSKVKLAHHLRIEKGILRYSCNLCSKSNFKNSMDLKLHVIGTHTTNRNFSCSYSFCEKTFKNSAARASHIETHSEVNLKCNMCPSVFKKRVVLARHMKLMHDEAYR